MLAAAKLKNIVTLLQGGGVVALPTETVYALAGDARNLSVIKRIFELKKRPLHQPLSVLLPQNYDILAWTDQVNSIARRLIDYFWPGPLTLVFRKNKSVLSELVGGRETIGLRVPDHSIAQAILRALACGLAAPSANLYTQCSPTNVDHVRQVFSEQIDTIIDGGPCAVGIASTIVDVTKSIPRILRLGAILKKDLQCVVDSEFVEDYSTTMITGITLPEKK